MSIGIGTGLVSPMVKQTVQKMKDMGLLSLSDIVLNHTEDNSQWLRDHPEAGHSVDTAPHLKPALELDDELLEYSAKLESLGVPIECYSPNDLERVLEGIKDHVLNPLKLWQYYVVNVPDTTREICQVWCNAGQLDQIEDVPIPEKSHASLTKLAEFVVPKAAISFDSFCERFAKSLEIEILVGILKSLISGQGIEERAETEARRIIDEINDSFHKEFDDDCNSILEQIRNRAQYSRLDSHGLKFGPFPKDYPLSDTCLTLFVSTDGKQTALVNNGWVWNGGPLADFANAASRAYLRDKAGQVRTNLHVVVEPSTGSEEKDKMFVERLEITSLIREAMQPWSVQELSKNCSQAWRSTDRLVFKVASCQARA